MGDVIRKCGTETVWPKEKRLASAANLLKQEEKRKAIERKIALEARNARVAAEEKAAAEHQRLECEKARQKDLAHERWVANNRIQNKLNEVKTRNDFNDALAVHKAKYVKLVATVQTFTNGPGYDCWQEQAVRNYCGR